METGKDTNILAVFCVTPAPRVSLVEAGAVVATEFSNDTWATEQIMGLTYVHQLCMEMLNDDLYYCLCLAYGMDLTNEPDIVSTAKY